MHAPDDTFALTVPGLAYCGAAKRMLATFIEVVRYLVRAEADGDVSANGLQRVEVTSQVVRIACELDEGQVALMWLLFETESWVLEGTVIQGGSNAWTAQLPDLSSWHDVDTVELYNERRAARLNRMPVDESAEALEGIGSQVIPRRRAVTRRELDLIALPGEHVSRQHWRARPIEELVWTRADRLDQLVAALGDRLDLEAIGFEFIGRHWFTQYRSLEWSLAVEIGPDDVTYTVAQVGSWDDQDVPATIDFDRAKRDALDCAQAEATRIKRILTQAKGRDRSLTLRQPHDIRQRRSEAISRRRARLWAVLAAIIGFAAGTIAPVITNLLDDALRGTERCTSAAFERGDCMASTK